MFFTTRTCDFLFYFCSFAFLTSAKLYESGPCLSMMTVPARVKSVTILECAILCDIDNRAAFSFNIQTGECSVFIEDIVVSPTCEIPSDVQYFKLNAVNTTLTPTTVSATTATTEDTSLSCPLPVPSGYSLEHPYDGNSSLARYTCAAITDQPPVDSCPIVKCDSRHSDLAATPASCSVKDVYNSSLSEYEGGVTCTLKGVTCQRWDSNYPHTSNVFKGRSDPGNRCQPETEQRPWCYTTDPAIRWDYCPVVETDVCEAPPTIVIASTMTAVGINIQWPYRTSSMFAWYRCASYTADDPVSSCPLTRCGGDRTWTNANISCSVKDCYDAASLTYNGRVSCTDTGITCQRWDSNYPHKVNPVALQGSSDLHNWCQMEGKSRPWCYTSDPSVGYGFCSVEQCP